MDRTVQDSGITRKVSALGRQTGLLEDVAYVGVKVTAVFNTALCI